MGLGGLNSRTFTLTFSIFICRNICNPLSVWHFRHAEGLDIDVKLRNLGADRRLVRSGNLRDVRRPGERGCYAGDSMWPRRTSQLKT